MFKILNQEGVVVSTHKDIKEAEARVEMFKKFMPTLQFTIIQDDGEQTEVASSSEPTVEIQPAEQPNDQTIEEALNNMDVSNDDEQNDEPEQETVADKERKEIEQTLGIQRPKNYRLAVEWSNGESQELHFGEKRDIERYMNKNGDNIIKAFYWNVRKPDEITTIKDPTNSQETQKNAPNLNETPWDNPPAPTPTEEDLINILNSDELDKPEAVEAFKAEIKANKSRKERIGDLVIELFNLLKEGK